MRKLSQDNKSANGRRMKIKTIVKLKARQIKRFSVVNI